jgi:uncharacterized protein (TIGR02453 family)
METDNATTQTGIPSAATYAPTVPEAASFDRELFSFLKELKDHNDREWFNANKARYEQSVKEPALAFIEDFGLRLAQPMPHLVANRRSLFRIYRDSRFSKDKSPYKTHLGMYFRHAEAADADTAGIYVHLEPGSVFMGAGIWHPGPQGLKRIRDRIVARPDAWRTSVGDAGPDWSLAAGEALKRPPRGYPPDHELIGDLKRRSFAVITRMTQRDATGGRFLDECERRAVAARPYLEFLSSALGVPF